MNRLIHIVCIYTYPNDEGPVSGEDLASTQRGREIWPLPCRRPAPSELWPAGRCHPDGLETLPAAAASVAQTPHSPSPLRKQQQQQIFAS